MTALAIKGHLKQIRISESRLHIFQHRTAVRNYIKVAESFYMAPHMTQFSLVTYSSNANLHFRFRDQLNLDSFKTRIKKLPFAAGGTRFDKVRYCKYFVSSTRKYI